MIIHGGQVFVMEDDILPKVTITGATIVMECADGSLDGMKEFISDRVGRGSDITDCNFMPIDRWANQKAKEGLAKAKSDLHIKQAPIMKLSRKTSIVQRIRKFLRLGAAS